MLKSYLKEISEVANRGDAREVVAQELREEGEPQRVGARSAAPLQIGILHGSSHRRPKLNNVYL
ncbi:MAG: hypothetical protein KGJ87_02640 [Planctomycetota bacterium]|nr:hypothetical protein [Planctomycetota bacterium]MDE1889918.1 hypothetical protein [Planctomycetota bacterium]MDE2216049.1 hypothetical protein [Planctomycetota bacterium]